MGNALVSLSSWPITLIGFSSFWALLVLVIVFKFIYSKPWGATANCRRAIDRCEKRRSDGFADWKRAIEEQADETVQENRRTIVATPLLQLREQLQRDEYTAVEVLEAYIWKALQVNERINCCIEVIKEAFALAEEADEKWSGQSGKPFLYGVPFSVKGNFYMKGYDCSIGLAKWLDQPRTEECSFVTHLKNLGAIPFVITNVPQGLLSFVCSNSVYGTTSNPHDITRSPGGSSGGEAALLAAGGSPFGIGSDLAGSLRIPAAFCGVVSMKPTQDRFVVTGSHGGVPGRGRLGLSFGFFTHSVEEQVALLSASIGSPLYRQVTPLSVQAPLDLVEINKTGPLKIGYFDDDGFCTPVPSMRRAVIETVEALKARGHTVVRFTVPDVDNMISILYKMLMPDGGAYIRSLYDHDIVDPLMKQFVLMLKVPRCIRWLTSLAISRLSPQLSAISAAYVSDLEDLRMAQEQCDLYRAKFIAYWKELGIDALVCPAFPVAAVPHHYPARLSAAAASTGLFNLVDFPAGVVPTGKVSHDDDKQLLDENVFPTGYNLALRLQKESSLTSVGLPLSVQVVSLPFEEEICLRLMKEVETIWNK